MNPDLEKIILSAEQISSRIQEIAEDINQHYQDTVREIILITLLDGAIVFTADLIRHISVPLAVGLYKSLELWKLHQPRNSSPHSRIIKV